MNPKVKPANPFVQMLGLVVGFIVFAAAVLLGGIVLAAIIGFVLIAVLVIYVRVWWLTRKGVGLRPDAAAETSYVEAEYQVIDNDEDQNERR